jgi:hypothetical protein
MLAAAQFIMVLYTTVMNGSISQVAEDLNTTIVGLQTAITLYALVMAAFMLLGGNLGAWMGTALVGSILIASLVSNPQTAVLANPVLADVSSEIAAAAEQSANFVTTEQVRAGAEQAGLSPEQVDAVTAEYADAQIAALKAAFAVVALAALVGLWYLRRLPTKAGTGDPDEFPSPVGEASHALSG